MFLNYQYHIYFPFKENICLFVILRTKELRKTYLLKEKNNRLLESGKKIAFGIEIFTHNEEFFIILAKIKKI